MGWDPLNDIRYGVEKERALIDDTGLNESPGWWNNLMGYVSGATDEGVERKRSSMESASAKRDYKQRYERITGQKWQPGMNAGSALEQIDNALEEKADDKFSQQLRLQTEAGLAPINAQLKAAALQNDANRRLEQLKFEYLEKKDTNRYDLARAEALESKAEARRDRLDLLDRQDHRYSQEMQRYDKRRQKETIQSLVAGLASLGAAFAM